MFIDGIKAVLTDSSETKVWRFRRDTGSRRHLCAVWAQARDQEIMRASIRWALFAVRDARLKAALVHLTDSNGETWIFDRQVDQFRCFRNRQLFDGRWDVCLKELFKDYMMPGAGESLNLGACLREFELRFDGQGLLALPQQRSLQRPSSWEKVGLERMTQARQSLENFWGQAIFQQAQDLPGILDFGDGMARRVHVLQQQKRDVDKVFQQLDRIDNHVCHRLEYEVELLAKIEAVAQPLMDPGKSPRVLQDRLREIESELQQLCDRWGIKSLPPVEPDQDWTQILSVLTRYLACDKLEKATRKSLHDARSNFKPVYEEYRKSIIRFLQNDKDLIRELEHCLQELNQHVRLAAAEQEKQRDNLAGKLNKLLGLAQLDNHVKTEGSALGPHSLDQARGAVNQCLKDMARLYGEIEHNEGSHEQNFKELEGRYEKILAEYGKAREQWLALAKEVGLSPDIGVKGLVEWINQLSRVQTLHQRRVKLQEELQEQRAQIKTLVLLLADWRTHTGSQKPGSPDPATALSEARNVLLYAEKKREQLQSLRALDSKLEAYQGLKQKLDRDSEAVQQRWQQGLEHWKLPSRDLSLDLWEPVSRAGREYMLLEQLFKEVHKPLRDAQVFGPEAMDGPLTIYTSRESKLDNRERLQILQWIEHADDGSLGLILTEDKLLFEMLTKMGLSRVEFQEEKSVEGAASAGVSPKPSKPVISDRARAALEVFAQKQGVVTRNPST